MLSGLIKMAGSDSNKKMKLMRLNTSQLASDGLVTRLADKISETSRKLQMQSKSLTKISANVALL